MQLTYSTLEFQKKIHGSRGAGPAAFLERGKRGKGMGLKGGEVMGGEGGEVLP